MTAYSVGTGEEIWWIRGLTWQMKSTPAISRDVLYLNGWAGGADEGPAGGGGGFCADVLVERDGDGDRRLSPGEMAGLRLRWDFGRLDLDRTGSWRAGIGGFTGPSDLPVTGRWESVWVDEEI